MVGHPWGNTGRVDSLFEKKDERIQLDKLPFNTEEHKVHQITYRNLLDREVFKPEYSLPNTVCSRKRETNNTIHISICVPTVGTPLSHCGNIFYSSNIDAKPGRGYRQGFMLVPYFDFFVPENEILMDKDYFFKKYEHELIRKGYLSFHRSIMKLMVIGPEKAREYIANKGKPIIGGVPTRMAEDMLRGMRVPVLAENPKLVAARLMTKRIAKRSPRSRVKQARYTTCEGALVLWRWAERSKEFRAYLQAYAPWIDSEETIRAMRVMQTISGEEVPPWIK